MNLPLHLRRRVRAEPATALFVPGGESSELLRLCTDLELDPSGRLFPVEGGFLITLEKAVSHSLAGAIRLRTLGPNLFAPTDADLVPALLDDEAMLLGRERGLIFLPWGQVLSFDPHAALEPDDLLVSDPVPERRWRSFPEPIRIAPRIEEIELDLPDESPESVLEADGDEIGTQPPTFLNPGETTAGQSSARRGLRGTLRWLSLKLGLGSPRNLRGDAFERARQTAALLSDHARNMQAEALRSLVREFREGNLENALRHALPLANPAGERGSELNTGDRLPSRDFNYSLDNLMESGDRTPATVWHGGRDMLAELSREYRKAAEQAQRNGDFRRAALIHGKLLRDYRMAAHTLIRGGLHHDAAVLLLERLDDPRGAAGAFEAAGEVDQAVQLYRRVGAHVEAGDLLRRMGEEEAALVEFRLAADRLLATSAGHLAAGSLLAEKAGRTDLALELYLEGWSLRPKGNALPCLMEALKIHVVAGSHAAVLSHLDEADVYLTRSGTIDEVSRFYNDLARLANQESLISVREELLDRALCALAARLRKEARSGATQGRMVSDLLLQPGVWRPEVISDADFAWKAVLKEPSVPPPDRRGMVPTGQKIQIARGTVTAVCSASQADEIFIGFDGGEVYRFRSDRSEISHIASYNLPVTSLSTNVDGSWIVILRSGTLNYGIVSTYSREPDGTFRHSLGSSVNELSSPWLTPLSRFRGEDVFGLWDGRDLHFLSVATLTSLGGLSLSRPDAAPPSALLLPRQRDDNGDFSVLIHDGREWCLAEPSGTTRHATGLVWRPSTPESSSLRSVSLSYDRSRGDHLELVGLGGYGTLHWATLQEDDGRLDLVALNSAAREGGYLAACLVRPNLVAGVTGTQIEWLRCGASRFSLTTSTEVDVRSAVACFVSRRTNELLVVCEDGTLSRIRVPG